MVGDVAGGAVGSGVGEGRGAAGLGGGGVGEIERVGEWESGGFGDWVTAMGAAAVRPQAERSKRETARVIRRRIVLHIWKGLLL